MVAEGSPEPKTHRENLAIELNLKATGNQLAPQGLRKSPACPWWIFSFFFLMGFSSLMGWMLSSPLSGSRMRPLGAEWEQMLVKVSVIL